MWVFIWYFKKSICKIYPNQIQKIKISHGLRLSENVKLFNVQTPGFSDLKLSNLFHLTLILPLSNYNLLITKIEETDGLLKDSFLIANLRSFMIEANK